MGPRRLVALAAALTCVAATGVAVARLGRDTRGATLAVGSPPTTAPEPTRSPPATPSPTPVPLPAPSPTPVPLPLPTPRPTEARTAVAPPAPRPLSRHWHAEGGGTTMDVRLDRSTAPTAQTITFTVAVDAGTRLVNGIGFNWGDDMGHQVVDPPLNACGSAENRYQRVTASMRHAYRLPGRYTVRVYADTAAPETCAKGAVLTQLVATGVVVVTPGARPGNGPLPVTIGHANQLGLNDTPPDMVDFQGSAGDRDGYVSELIVEWGDGSAPTVQRFPLADCHDTATRWPEGSPATEILTHRYPKPGTYTGRFTAVSVGCDGGDRQVVRTSFPVTAP